MEMDIECKVEVVIKVEAEDMEKDGIIASTPRKMII
jgi:hypothetical protein